MGAPSMYYVSPLSGNDTTGNGTIGTPWQTVQKALLTITRDATNGDQINIQAGATDILLAALVFTTYGTPTAAAPIIFRGYTSAANDGGIGVISGGGSVAIFNTTLDFIYLIDLKFHNSGSATLVTIDQSCTVINCEFTNTTGSGLNIGALGYVERCWFHDIQTSGITTGGNATRIMDCYFENETKDFTIALSFTGSNSYYARRNIFKVDGATVAIRSPGSASFIGENSIWSSGGTGTGIDITSTAGSYHQILNNIIEGFSGSGGNGIVIASAANVGLYGNNKFYNNATNEALTGDIICNLGNNDTLLASPFTNPAGDDFSVSTAVKAGAYPSSFRGSSTNQYLDIGAAQRQEAASGGVLLGNMRGGFTN